MSENSSDASTAIRDFNEKAQDCAKDALTTATDYIRANPWIAVAGAAVAGGVLAALAKPAKAPPSKLDAVREWMDEAYAKLPSQKQVQAAVESSGVPRFLHQLRKTLHHA